jgi:hypothetical protein
MSARHLTAAALVLAACGPRITLMETRTFDAPGARHPTVAIAPDGTTLVAWVAMDGTASNVWLARAEAGGTFGAPIRVNDIDGDAAPHDQAPAQVVAGDDGNVFVLWQNNTPAEGRMFPWSDLRLARSTDGGRSFEPAITVNDDAGGPPASHTFHDIAVAPDGTVLVSWIDSRVSARMEREMVAASESADQAGHGGHAMHDMGGPEIRVARSTDGGRTFSASTVAAPVACPCCRTSLAFGNEGQVYVAWRDVEGDNIRDIAVARSDDGGATFGVARTVHDDGWEIDGCPHAGPSLAVDVDGRLHVVWYTGAEGGTGLFHAVSTDGGTTFGPRSPLISRAVVPVSHARLAADGPHVWAVWEDRSSRESRLLLGRSDRGMAEGIVIASGRLPGIAARDGLVAVTWTDGSAIHVRTGQ